MDDVENEGTETFHLFEIYSGKEALDFHRETAHYKDYRAKIVEYLKKPIQVKVLNKIQ
jgi:quinol monooxygenase YgiN